MTLARTLAASLLMACSALNIAPAIAHDHAGGSVTIDHPWSRPTPPGSPMGVGYLTISNSGDSDITLTSAETPRAAQVSIHQSTMNNGVMSMRPLKNGLLIPAGNTVELKPHGYHLMLEKLEEPLKEGERIPLTLRFDGAKPVNVELQVESLDGASPTEHSDTKMQKHGHH